MPVEMLVLYLAMEKLPVAFYQSDDRTLPAPGGGSRRHCGYVLGRQTGAVRPLPCRRTARKLHQSCSKCDSPAQQTIEGGTHIIYHDPWCIGR